MIHLYRRLRRMRLLSDTWPHQTQEKPPCLRHLLVGTGLRDQHGTGSTGIAHTTRPKGIVPSIFLRASGVSVPPTTLANLSQPVSCFLYQLILHSHCRFSNSGSDTVVPDFVHCILCCKTFGGLCMLVITHDTKGDPRTTVTAPLPVR